MSEGRPRSQWIPATRPVAGYRRIASPGSAPLVFLEFGLVRLDGRGPVTWESHDREAVLYLIGGVCEISVSAAAESLAAVLDSRRSLFEGPPSAVFVPSGSSVRMTSKTPTDLAVFAATPRGDRPIHLISGHQVESRIVGSGNWSRRVISVIDERIASRLLVGETVNPAGHWSSYPPHKHDANILPRECSMEEIYYFLAYPPGGFGLQMVYTAPTDRDPFQDLYRVSYGDTVVIPRGYHPVVAAAGYQLAYLWAISGEQVQYAAWSEDPAHAWLARTQ